MKEYTLTRTGKLDLTIQGKLLAEIITKEEDSRWREIDLYRTDMGRYIIATSDYTRWQNEDDHFKVIIYETPEEVLASFLYDDGSIADLAKRLLQKAATVDAAFEGLWAEKLDE